MPFYILYICVRGIFPSLHSMVLCAYLKTCVFEPSGYANRGNITTTTLANDEFCVYVGLVFTLVVGSLLHQLGS